ncbi:DUF3592 domain-containing protein [Streptomyces sp. NPDC101175]|uniref:DUF3592 domain-containing protein n=1 Tax=Streptomyces sp. NPDC101175 TaxID=3366123 RepID=UPI003834CC50
MEWEQVLVLWCAGWGAAALVGYALALAGVTGAQRMRHFTGRVERVREPRHGGSRVGGISVVVSYRDPVSGQDIQVTNDGERGDAITAAWVGREIRVSHPPGRPHAYRFSAMAETPGRGLSGPGCAVFLGYVGLVALASVERGWPWALIGVGGPGAIVAAVHLPGALRARKDRLGRLAAMDAVRGRVVAVLKDVSVDQDDGHVSTTITPVVSFSTREGRAVTAHCPSGLPDPAGSYGRDVTVHHTPADPACFTLDVEAARRSEAWEIVFDVLAIVVLGATAAAGVALL